MKTLIALVLVTVLGIVLLYGCLKDEVQPDLIADCDCGYVIYWIDDDYRWYLVWEDECSGRLDSIIWLKMMPDPFAVGTYVCELKQIITKP